MRHRTPTDCLATNRRPAPDRSGWQWRSGWPLCHLRRPDRRTGRFQRGAWHTVGIAVGRDNGEDRPSTRYGRFAMNDFTMNGRCTCGSIRYRLTSRPLIVHACHCRWCQRETGMSFAQTAIVLFCTRVVRKSSGRPPTAAYGFWDLTSLKVIVTAGPAAMVSNCPHPAGGRRPRERHLQLLRRSVGWGRPHFLCGARPCNRARTGSAGCRGVAVRQRGGLA